jgi:branched-chain amino acid transport system permease protein
MTYLLGPRLFLILGLLILPVIMPNLYWRRVLCNMGVFAMLGLAFDFLAHNVGLVCLGGAFFTGVGGYMSGALNSYYGIPPLLTIPMATLGGAFLCTLLLLPTLSLRGIYFAIVTIVYPIGAVKAIKALNILGSTEGLSALATFPNIWVETYLVLGLSLVALFSLRRLVNEEYGLVLVGVRDNDQAVRASGINIIWYKAQAVFIASMIGCFTGSYLSTLYGWAGLSQFALDFSILPIAATVVGGAGSLVGPMLGAFVLTPVSEILRAMGTWRIFSYCIVLLAFILFRPEGLMEYFQRKYHQFEQWKAV